MRFSDEAGFDSLCRKCGRELVSRRIRSDDTNEYRPCSEPCKIGGDIAGAAKMNRFSFYPNHGNGSLGRNPVHLAPDEPIQHDVPDNEDPPTFEAAQNLPSATSIQGPQLRSSGGVGTTASSTSMTGMPSRTG